MTSFAKCLLFANRTSYDVSGKMLTICQQDIICLWQNTYYLPVWYYMMTLAKCLLFAIGHKMMSLAKYLLSASRILYDAIGKVLTILPTKHHITSPLISKKFPVWNKVLKMSIFGWSKGKFLPFTDNRDSVFKTFSEQSFTSCTNSLVGKELQLTV